MAKLKIGCSIYLAFAGKKVKLPVNPEEIEIKNPTDHKTYDVIGVGEIVVPRKPSLKEVSWESFFPGDRQAVYVNGGAKSPSYYLKYFKKALKKKQICRLIITRSGGSDTNMKCIVSNFETKDKGGEPKDICLESTQHLTQLFLQTVPEAAAMINEYYKQRNGSDRLNVRFDRNYK